MQKGQFNQVRFKDGSFKLVKQDFINKLEQNEVLVKVHYTSVNQYDKILMENRSKEDYVMGAEGSGIIEDVAQGLDQNLKGRKVAFIHHGWSQYVVKDQDDLLFLDESVDLRIAADAIVNPMTALCLRKICCDLKANAVVIDSASTSLGRMLIQLFQKDNIDIIPLAMDSKQFDQLRTEFGLARIMDQSKKEFFDLLCGAAEKFEKIVYISMQGGDLPGKILDRLPAKSEMILIGNLAEKDLVVPCSNFYYDSKKIRGFFFDRYLREELDDETEHKFFHIIAQDLKNGGMIFGTKVAKEMKLEEWDQALNQISDKSQEGKIILQCQ
ncbi:zinc-binding dehydrogenase family protein [Stylonychia lemnae]|uniref:Zinc-binding dehydrogenase family protein n=1 Tax=Stylonychia lemnae TaxID=5949 RepID=A0A077ZTB7_STYLE|nr:zinc-binding dehydrogenase family protein [Stylonychia lemnae]|eukprot:CDW72789.1 zinc-binding dehydrogenase family protein [Stylonychia lemnae]